MYTTYQPGAFRGDKAGARSAIARVLLNNIGPMERVALQQWEVAEQAGTTRETVNRTLRDLESEGSVRRFRGRVEIVDRTALEALVIA